MLKPLNDLTEAQINYAVAVLLKHEWRCPWILKQDGFLAWASYEQGLGNWHPDYCNDWAAASVVMQTYGIFPEVHSIERLEDDSVVTEGYVARTPAEILDGLVEGQYADKPLVAVMRCLLASEVGTVIGVPENLP